MKNSSPKTTPASFGPPAPFQSRASTGLALLMAASIILHFWHLGLPSLVVFDESMVGSFAHAYAAREPVFDIHPPHLKLIYAAIGSMFGMSSQQPFPAYLAPYSGAFYLAMRAFPALLGSALPLLAYGLARQVGCRRTWALAAGWMILLESALMASSQFILNDIPLLFFGCLGVWCFGRWREGGSKAALAFAGLALGAAASVKWTGLGFLAPVLATIAWDARRRAALQARAILAMASAWTFAGYALHFALTSDPWTAHALADTRAELRGEAASEPSIAASIVKLHQLMASSASDVPSHPYGSAWHSWPAGTRGVYLWHDGKLPGERSARIYMVPNLVVWWSGSFAMLLLLANLAPKLLAWATSRASARIAPQEALLAVAYLGNLLPFALIGRVMFLYHYYPALMASVVAAAWMANRIERPKPIAIAFVAAAALAFAWGFPLTYGLEITEEDLKSRLLLDSWH